MEKSLVKTDQMRAKAAAVTAMKAGDSGAARRVGQPLGRDARGLPGGDQTQRESPGQQIVSGQRQRDEKSKTAKGCHEDYDSTMILARRTGG